jgi:NADH:ubiquinone oxidoreductase subunit C
MSIDIAVKSLTQRFQLNGSDIRSIPVNETEIKIPADLLIPAVETILESGIWHISTITCRQAQKELILLYHFWLERGLTLRIGLGLQNPRIISLMPLIPGVEFYEREVEEMFGVEFIGLKKTGPFLLPDDWQSGHPMRKIEQQEPEDKT